MATCTATSNCSVTCPDGCGCIYSHDTGNCSCWCEPTSGGKVRLGALKKRIGRVSPLTRFDIDGKDARILTIAKVLEMLYPSMKFAIPLSKLDMRKKKLTVRKKTVSQIASSLGLIVVKKPSVSRKKKPRKISVRKASKRTSRKKATRSRKMR